MSFLFAVVGLAAAGIFAAWMFVWCIGELFDMLKDEIEK